MLGKVLYMYRKNDFYSYKLRNHLKKISKKLILFESAASRDKERKKKIKNLKKFKYDYIFCFRSHYILDKKLINRAKFAAINFHPGTPEYRGFGCVNYAIYNDERYYGVTAHLIDEKIDHGKIIGLEKVRIQKSDCVESLLEKTYKKLLYQAKSVISLLNKNPNNLNQLVEKYKGVRWSGIIRSKKNLDKFYEIKKNVKKNYFLKKIRATRYKKFNPYVLIHRKKFEYSSKRNLKEKNSFEVKRNISKKNLFRILNAKNNFKIYTVIYNNNFFFNK